MEEATLQAAFDAERAETMRTRSRWILVASIVIWVISGLFFDMTVFRSREDVLAVRVPQIAACALCFLWMRKPRSLRALELANVLVWVVIAGANARGFFVIPPDKLVTKVASLAISVIVVCPLAQFTWHTTGIVGCLTVLALSSLKALGQGQLYMLALTIVGFAYCVLMVSAATRDRLKLREFTARHQLVQANQQLAREDELRRRLFVNLSHDFKTPLAVIRGEASLLRAAGRSEEVAPLVRIEGNARALSDLADQLLELARIEAGQVALRPRRCDVTMFARDVAALLEPPGATRRIVTSAEGAADQLVARVDPNHVQRMLLNLVANGLKHAPGEVRLLVRRAAYGAHERIVVDVSDDGAGIPEERREAIFQRFITFDVDGNTSSGIGLPLARELAVLNGGSLVLVTEAPNTTFRLELPAADGPAEDLPRLAPAPAVLSGTNGTSNGAGHANGALIEGPRLLVVEDNEDMASLLARVLGARFRVERVSGVAAAIASLEQHLPQVVVSDVMMPDGTGYDVLSAVRGHRERENVPVILVSALGEAAERVRGLSAGADDYVAKPFAPEELLSRVAAALERAESRKRALELQRDALLMEIHDGVSASLSRAAILLAEAGTPEGAESAGHAREAIKDGLEEVRAITRLLSPRPADWRSLTAEIRRAMADACNANGIKLVFDAEDVDAAGADPVPAPIAHTLRRIARESTTNVIKHAGAKTITCRMKAAPDWSLRVEDDGRGFSPTASQGQGLGIMQRRVTRIGGKVDRGNGPTGGAFISATITKSG